MRWPILICLLWTAPLASAQNEKLTAEHAVLSSDCKAVRGHALGIVTEASQSTLNRDIALAQAEQVATALTGLEKRVATTKSLLSPDQLTAVASHYAVLDSICAALQREIVDIIRELKKPTPDRIKVRNMAVDLRATMKDGSLEHEQITKKLGIGSS
jgi:hypothetical protein